MKITDYINKDCIKTSLKGMSKEEIIEELLKCLAASYPDIDHDKAYDAVLKREGIETTSIGKGTAIPHARIPGIETVYIAIGLLHNNAEIYCIDGTRVQIVFLILFPDNNVDLQLRFLARVARLLQHDDLHNNLLICSDSRKVIDVIKTCEDKYSY